MILVLRIGEDALVVAVVFVTHRITVATRFFFLCERDALSIGKFVESLRLIYEQAGEGEGITYSSLSSIWK